jgi:hypothetical protein
MKMEDEGRRWGWGCVKRKREERGERRGEDWEKQRRNENEDVEAKSLMTEWWSLQ